MGGGSYNYLSSKDRSTTLYSGMSREETFRNKKIDSLMDIRNKSFRESRDGEEHPDSYPIIIALDVTGSMGHIPEDLIKGSFPEIMKKIIDSGIPHPQVCFLGIGDHECDSAPLQVGEFETSDELMEKWLTKTYIEGGGGGNLGESYLLAWYFASRHTSCDSFEKRGKKGTLITIGDEPTLKSVGASDIQKIFGETPEEGILTASELLKEAKKTWDVYHINCMDWSGTYERTQNTWKEYLGEDFINTQTSTGKDIDEIIPKLVLQSYTGKKDEEILIGE